ncbi:hypothetical protein OPV22_017537 [Ensete ventricosum]|uniref:Uncharacterized protein n=1 Tax=Ensete ventricosum TaxID=4639 RepID=A0AAV8R182_ENSVE|nr:hypothetical protein OPV22_017537 [Ensete ventricosum]
MAASLTAAGCIALPSSFHGSWATSFTGEDRAVLARHVTVVIIEFCKTIGADGKQSQGLIRLAKKNGEKLGFLA